jgi:hypothetical protein
MRARARCVHADLMGWERRGWVRPLGRENERMMSQDLGMVKDCIEGGGLSEKDGMFVSLIWPLYYVPTSVWIVTRACKVRTVGRKVIHPFAKETINFCQDMLLPKRSRNCFDLCLVDSVLFTFTQHSRLDCVGNIEILTMVCKIYATMELSLSNLTNAVA